MHLRYANENERCMVDLKYFKLKYLGGGEFFYSYQRKNFIRTGVFLIKSPLWLPKLPCQRLKLLVSKLNFPPDIFSFDKALFLCLRPAIFTLVSLLLVISAYHLFRSPDFMEELKEIDAVGGFGEIHSKNNSLRANSKVHENSARDEKAKNSLLGISDSNSSTSEKKSQKSEQVAYKVQAGDTLSEISQKFNVSVESIAGSSGIRSPDAISVGQTLKIPPKNGFYYKVKKNDRLGLILSQYKLELAKILAENRHINPDLLEEGEEIFLLGAKPKNLIYGWLVPVTNRIITSGYGWRSWPRKAFHKGLDLKAYYTNVRAAKSGRVHYAGHLGGYGKVVVLEHSGGYRTLYAHLSRVYVRAGSRVAQGTSIGKSGNTGYSFGPHLHFEVSQSGRNINPQRILRGLKRRGRRRSRRK